MTVDFENDLLLVTAASGMLAGAFLEHLAPRWKRLRLQCASTSSAEKLREQYPYAEVVQSKFKDETDCRELLQDVTVCLLVTPAFHEHEGQIGCAMVSAATAVVKSGGPFQHMVFSSVLHPVITQMTNHRNKRDVEESLVTSGLNFTIVQPSHLMDNTPVKLLATQEHPVYRAAFDPQTKFSFTAIFDLVQAVSNILTQREQHYLATYELVSTREPLNYIETMEIISAAIGRQVEVKRVPASDLTEGRAESQPTRSAAEKEAILTGMGRMFGFYDHCGLYGNSMVMKMLLGREPLSYRDWVQMQLS